ncbi:MAG TPA: hypothetical protein VI168_13490 [Croceibacterium sp.]
MRNLVIAAVLCAGLAACGNPAEEADEPVPAETATAAATPTESPGGTYEVTAQDGTKFTAALNPDGTYVDTAADGSIMAKGTWEEKDGAACFDSEGDDPIVCYALGEQQADGTRIATPDDGTAALTVRKTS